MLVAKPITIHYSLLTDRRFWSLSIMFSIQADVNPDYFVSYIMMFLKPTVNHKKAVCKRIFYHIFDAIKTYNGVMQ